MDNKTNKEIVPPRIADEILAGKVPKLVFCMACTKITNGAEICDACAKVENMTRSFSPFTGVYLTGPISPYKFESISFIDKVAKKLGEKVAVDKPSHGSKSERDQLTFEDIVPKEFIPVDNDKALYRASRKYSHCMTCGTRKEPGEFEQCALCWNSGSIERCFSPYTGNSLHHPFPKYKWDGTRRVFFADIVFDFSRGPISFEDVAWKIKARNRDEKLLLHSSVPAKHKVGIDSDGIRHEVLKVCLCFDATSSMFPHMKAAVKAGKEMIGSLSSKTSTSLEAKYGAGKVSLKTDVAIVAYRDFGDSPQWEVRAFSPDINGAFSVLDTVRAMGGGDIPEDMHGGLSRVINLGWDDVDAMGEDIQKFIIKYTILIADAPAHGREMHDDIGDTYPDANSIQDWECLMKDFKGKGIEMQISPFNPSMRDTISIMKKFYDESPSFEIEVLDNLMNMCVSETSRISSMTQDIPVRSKAMCSRVLKRR